MIMSRLTSRRGIRKKLNVSRFVRINVGDGKVFHREGMPMFYIANCCVCARSCMQFVCECVLLCVYVFYLVCVCMFL